MAKNEAENAKTSHLSEISPFPVFDASEFGKLGTKNLSMATSATSAYFKGAAKFNQEMMGFINERVKKDIESAQKFMTSKTSEQAFHCQAEFIEEALRDYAEETSKCMSLAADMAQQTLQPIEERTEEVLHTMDERGKQQEANAR